MSKLREIRIELGLKQLDMANVLGVSLPNYCKKRKLSNKNFAFGSKENC